MNWADISCVCHFCTSPNKILYQLLMARFVLRNRHNVCCLNIWLPSILTAISYKRKIFQFLHLKPVLYKQSYSINSHFATDTPTQKWECCPHVINSIRCKVRRQLTIFKLLNSSANKILSDAPPPDRLYRHNNTERANGVHILSMYKHFQFTARSCKNMDRKAVFHVKINPCRLPRSKPSQLTTNWSSFHHSCSIVASYQLG